MIKVPPRQERIQRILLAVVVGLALIAGAVWGLARALNDGLLLYHGQPLEYWIAGANSPNAALSNQASPILQTVIIPQLAALLDDPQDDVPENAVKSLGQFGSLARPAVPKLLPLLQSRDKDRFLAAKAALRQIDPEAAAKAGVK